MTHTVTCPYCGNPAELVDSAVVYGTSYGMMYLCRCVPGLAYVGCHKGTIEPKGRLADDELRQWKIAAHNAFDPLWKGKGEGERNRHYLMMAREFGITKEECHIGLFDVDMCKRVIAWATLPGARW